VIFSPKNMTDRPAFERRMDPLSEVFGSMRIREAVYKRLEAHSPLGCSLLGDIGPRIRFMLVVRGSALLRFKNQRRTISSPAEIFSFHISVMSPLH